MSWAEYQIRVIGYKRKLKNEQEFDSLLAREIAYEVYRLSFIMSKKQPKDKKIWWPIGEKKAKISKDVIELFKKQRAEYLSKKNG